MVRTSFDCGLYDTVWAILFIEQLRRELLIGTSKTPDGVRGKIKPAQLVLADFGFIFIRKSTRREIRGRSTFASLHHGTCPTYCKDALGIQRIWPNDR